MSVKNCNKWLKMLYSSFNKMGVGSIKYIQIIEKIITKTILLEIHDANFGV